MRQAATINRDGEPNAARTYTKPGAPHNWHDR
jgi:hypothetical protein